MAFLASEMATSSRVFNNIKEDINYNNNNGIQMIAMVDGE